MVLEKSEPENTGYIIDTENVWRTYRAGTHQEVHALRGISLQIQTGKFVTIKGRSGSGKTTLLNCIGGLDRPSQGVIRVFGQDLSMLSERQLVQFRREQVGFIFQSFGLTPTFSAYENVELMLRISGVASRQRKGRTQECLELVGLKKWGNHRPDELSGGQQQRVAIARALANHPKLILADEPTGDLDSGTAREILSIFRRIVHHEHVTILVSSHDPLVAAYADEVLELSDGQLISSVGTTVAI